MNKFLFLVIVVAVVTIAVPTTTIQAFAQTAPPPLEANKPTSLLSAGADEVDEKPTTQSLGKIIIQISQTEQIVLDLPLKSDNKYQVAPIK